MGKVNVKNTIKKDRKARDRETELPLVVGRGEGAIFSVIVTLSSGFTLIVAAEERDALRNLRSNLKLSLTWPGCHTGGVSAKDITMI